LNDGSTKRGGGLSGKWRAQKKAAAQNLPLRQILHLIRAAAQRDAPARAHISAG
jgi:hypothetical protein